ncbi:MAG TPA: VWA domain-containing protein [Chloroflexota bacterium]
MERRRAMVELGGARGALWANVVQFCRLLRQLGLSVGPGSTVQALQALACVDLRRRSDCYYALRAVLVSRREDLPVFDAAFGFFWSMDGLPTEERPESRAAKSDRPTRWAVRQVALAHAGSEDHDEPDDGRDTDWLGYSAMEVLRKKDFEAFTPEELAVAQRVIATMRWDLAQRRSRRRVPDDRGERLDLRRTVRGALRYGGHLVQLRRSGRKEKRRPLVVLCDISGSMERYTRLLLHFVHSLQSGLRSVEAFVFGTRLTRVTRHLARRDVAEALQHVSSAVQDWSGGTRIGECLRAFNVHWGRRVLRNGAVVAIISDGWDRGDIDLLRAEMARLQRTCHRLIWLNPLLGVPGYEPLTAGLQAALPYVDDFLPVHNLESLEELARHLERVDARRPSRRQRPTVLAS